MSVSNGLRIAKIIFSVVFVCLCNVPALFAGQGDEKLDFFGDFRYRYEVIEVSDDGLDSRKRHRIRARFGLEARVAEEARVFFQIASGSDDLVSSNQTLSGTFSSKNIVLDLAYAEYQPIALKRRVTFIIGKSKLPFFRPGKTELLWDSDLRPEGLTALFNLGSDKIELEVLGAYYILEERESDANPELINNVLELKDILKFIKEASEEVDCLCYVSDRTLAKMTKYLGHELDSVSALSIVHNSVFKVMAEEFVDNDKDPRKIPNIKMTIGIILKELEQGKISVTTHLKLIEELEELSISSQMLCLNVPPKETMDKFIRYESSILKQFYKAMHELERIQRRRKGEFVPSAMNIEIGVENN